MKFVLGTLFAVTFLVSDAVAARIVPRGSNGDANETPTQSAPAQSPAVTPRSVERIAPRQSPQRYDAPASHSYSVPSNSNSWERSWTRPAGSSRITPRNTAPARSNPTTAVAPGAAAGSSSGRIVPRSHNSIAGDPRIVKQIQSHQRSEVTPGKYYWHHYNGERYCHYYHGGIHWYGFYNGPSFYWTRYHGGYWWWFDARFHRWSYWYNDYWWWSSPTGSYVIINDNYFPYESGQADVSAPPIPTDTPETTAADRGGSWTSPDKQRVVQIFGPESEAFLYDNSSGAPVFKKYLGKNVEKVRFSGGEDRKPLQILIDYKDGKFQLLNADGE